MICCICRADIISNWVYHFPLASKAIVFQAVVKIQILMAINDPQINDSLASLFHVLPRHPIFYIAIPCFTSPFHSLPPCSMLYPAIPNLTSLFHSLPRYSMLYFAIPCFTSPFLAIIFRASRKGLQKHTDIVT